MPSRAIRDSLWTNTAIQHGAAGTSELSGLQPAARPACLMASGGIFRDLISFRLSDLMPPTAARAASICGCTCASSASTAPARKPSTLLLV
jgi:hypothetical protein